MLKYEGSLDLDANDYAGLLLRFAILTVSVPEFAVLPVRRVVGARTSTSKWSVRAGLVSPCWSLQSQLEWKHCDQHPQNEALVQAVLSDSFRL